MHGVTPVVIAVVAMELLVVAGFAFADRAISRRVQRWPSPLRILVPALGVVPYLAVAAENHSVRPVWCVLYLVLPACVAWLLERAAAADPQQRGNWRDALVLLTLGLAVDLRWFDSAWPHGQAALGKILLLDVGLYGFLAVRQLEGSGFDLRLRWSDWKTGLRELVFFAPIVIVLGLKLHFIHPHGNIPGALKAVLTWAGIFLFIALPEEIFFRSWTQNLLEKRFGRRSALAIASILFGLSHFNKRLSGAQHFNWQYVVLATIAGIFYGRAWRKQRRVPASTITHTCVDWIWSWWF